MSYYSTILTERLSPVWSPPLVKWVPKREADREIRRLKRELAQSNNSIFHGAKCKTLKTGKGL